MTEKEAIEIIKAYKDRLTSSCSNLLDEDICAFDLAIKALKERKQGKWIFDGVCFTTTQYKCNKCKCPTLEKTNFCPDCGADMRKGEEK